MTTVSAIWNMLDERREVLMRRCDAAMELERRGEGSVTWFQLELLEDELAYLRTLYDEIARLSRCEPPVA